MSKLYLVRHAHSVWSPDKNRLLSSQGSMDAARETITPLAEPSGLSIYMEPDPQERRLSDGLFDFMFWKSLTMLDVYKLNISQSGRGLMQRLWQEVDA